jgi:hypothetical protein
MQFEIFFLTYGYVRCDGGFIHIENLVIFGDFLFYFERKVFFQIYRVEQKYQIWAVTF